MQNRSLEAHVEALVRRIVEEELRARGVEANAPAYYSTKNLPPDIRSTDRFNRLAKCVPGAKKVGRVWTVPVEAWRTFRSAAPPGAPAGDVASVVAMVAARYRKTA